MHVEEQKTYTLTEVKTAVNIPSNVGNFLTNEVEKTKEYQKKELNRRNENTNNFKNCHN